MGFRFRKSFGFGPFRATISKTGISTSVGVKGARITNRADGKTQTTFSLPGTGISHVSTSGGKTESRAHSSENTGPELTPKKGNGGKIGLGVLVAVLLLALAGGCNSKDSDPEPVKKPAAVQQVEKPDPAPAPAPAPDPAPTPQPEPEPSPAPEPKPEPAPAPEPKPEPAPAPAPEPEQKPEAPVAAEPVDQSVIGNKNSKKFHEPSCSSVDDMKESNKIVISSAQDALAKGYEPCQRCH